MDKNNINYWYPLLSSSGVYVPKTVIIETSVQLVELLDGYTPVGFDEFISQIYEAVKAVGYPIFLRTGHYSGKHSWRNTCFILNKDADIGQHIFNLIEESEIADIFGGLPYQTWAVREFLPLKYHFTAFNGLPIAKERRYFIDGSNVICHHPYWPADAIVNPSQKDWRQLLQKLNKESEVEVTDLVYAAMAIGEEFDGYWSVDFAQSITGDWYAIDMAEGDRSWHWPGCEYGGSILLNKP